MLINLEPRVGLTFSSFSGFGPAASPSLSLRGFLRLSVAVTGETRFPLGFGNWGE
jgi:hypothetical protein